jgi:hypothetical protein
MPTKISLYSDNTALYNDRYYQDIYHLCVDLKRDMLRSNPPQLVMATEDPIDYDAVGMIIYALHQIDRDDYLLDDLDVPVDPMPPPPYD